MISVITLFIGLIVYMVIGTILGYWFYLDGWWDDDFVVASALLWPIVYTIVLSVWLGVWIIEKIRGDN